MGRYRQPGRWGQNSNCGEAIPEYRSQDSLLKLLTDLGAYHVRFAHHPR